MTIVPNSLQARDIAYHVHPYTDLRAHEQQGPLVITGGEGIYVHDDDGRQYIEGLAGLWCTSLGFSEKRLAEAARAQMEAMPYTHTFAHRSSEPVIELADKLLSITPPSLKKAFFVNSGSEAIDTAIKLIWYYNNARGKPEKKRIIARRRAYHGITSMAGHLTGLPYARAGFDLPASDRFFHVTTPSHYRDGREGESEDAFADRLAQEIETLILALGPDTVAAFFAEPVQGAGGVIVPPESYFPKVQKVLKKYDVLMVADEVICGFCRTGNMFGSDTFSIEPDLMTVAKQLSSAYLPIAGLLMREEFYDVLADQSAKLGVLGMGYTYGGHPVSAAVARRTLEIYEEDGILEHVRAVAPRFRAGLDRLADHPLVGEARGVGLIGGIEIVRDKKSREQYPAATKAAAIIARNCVANGLILRPLPGDAIGICPPLVIKAEEVDELFDRLWKGLEASVPAIREASS
ncbi:MAG: aminotransferase [Geminicoccaceae bacterium]